jgi:hypothetical protein
MEDGEIVEMGTHGELVALKGRYHELFLSQIIERAFPDQAALAVGAGEYAVG